ncbi:hypothetical protein HAX54_032942 [Datura stramonium]|uniref:Uncharacterized protein n=1 Tax=Datura stramonium TaxID=4076 RepID=A0ABS8VEJ0_DATST|nr:hypothetical protein [Datura stramonium]
MMYSFRSELVSGQDDFMIKRNFLHGIFRRNQVQRLKDKLIEGILYTIQNFKVVEVIGHYKPVENSLTLIFTASTVINNLSEDIVHIPINRFQFIKPAMIDSRVNNDKVLSDMVDCLYGIDGMENPGSTGKRRDIEITTD